MKISEGDIPNSTFRKKGLVDFIDLIQSSTLYTFLMYLAVILITLGIFGVYQAQNINKKVIEQYSQEIVPIEALGDIKSSFYRIRGRVIRHINEPDNHLIHENKISEQITRINKNSSNLHRNNLNEEEATYFHIYTNAQKKYLNFIRNIIIPLSRKGEVTEAESIFYGSAMESFYDIREGINLLVDYQINQASIRNNESRIAYEKMELIGFLIIVIILALTIILYVYKTKACLSSRLAETILKHSSHGVMITDSSLNIKWVNPAFEKTTGYNAENIFNNNLSILRPDQQDSIFYKKIWRSIKKNGFWEGEVWNKRKNGEIYPEWLNVIALKDVRGRLYRYAAIFSDLSQIRKTEDELHKLAYFDPVTGLANISMLYSSIKNFSNNPSYQKSKIVILLIDLDHFHAINTGIGRQTGDAVLREVANRIKGIKENAVVSRIGADEFVITFVESGTEEKVKKIIENLIFDIQNKLYTKYVFKQYELNLNCSMGIVCENIRNINGEVLIRKASSALAYCKKKSPGFYQFYDAEIDKKTKYFHSLSLSIVSAIEKNELYLVYQPQLNSQCNLIGAETLLRWKSVEHGEISPSVFINIAEKQGIMIEIGLWVFKKALEQLAQWRKEGVCSKDFKLAINVSPQQLLDKNIVNEFHGICVFHGIDTKDIEIEITETGIGKHSDYVYNNLHALSEKGFKISIDDFGTGHSSLSRLRHFPINTLKIDRCFVKNMCSLESDLALIKSIIDMAHILGFNVIAEGVEDEKQLSILLDFNCDMFQGFYFSKPVNKDDFIEYKKSLKANY